MTWLDPVFVNGLLVSETTLEEIRQRVNESLLTS